MPIPRELFPASRPDKPSPEYLANVTPEAKTPIDYSKLSETGQYKYRQAQKRKDYLREGLTQLYKRKQHATQRMQFRADEKQAERARLLSQAEREDARLTNVSIPSEMQPDKKTESSSHAELEIHESKSANAARSEVTKTELRKDQLHTLYMNSRDFITSEEQLTQKIDEEFSDNKFREGGKSLNLSKWDSEGRPESIADLVNRSIISPRKRNDGDQLDTVFKRDQERMKRIAEKLSGGKI